MALSRHQSMSAMRSLLGVKRPSGDRTAWVRNSCRTQWLRILRSSVPIDAQLLADGVRAFAVGRHGRNPLPQRCIDLRTPELLAVGLGPRHASLGPVAH